MEKQFILKSIKRNDCANYVVDEIADLLGLTKAVRLVKMTCELVHASCSLPKWQAVKLTFFAPEKECLLFKTFFHDLYPILK